MSTDETHSGIPTRAIHEAYLEMQRSLQRYREAKDRQTNTTEPHGELQQSVLTFYELLRPHLKNESGVRDYWEGELPNYKGNGEPPDPEDGKGILQVQEARESYDITQFQENGVNLNSLETLEDWHTTLGLNGTVRIVGVAGMGDDVFITKQQYQKGLRHMDNWETKYTRVVEKRDGFMADKTDTRVERQRIPIDRLTRAARELSDVADKLGALSKFDASSTRTEITDEQIERLEKWRQRKLD